MGSVGVPGCDLNWVGNTLITNESDPPCGTLLPYVDSQLELVAMAHPFYADFSFQSFDAPDQAGNYATDRLVEAWKIQAINKSLWTFENLYDLSTATPSSLSGGGNKQDVNIKLAIMTDFANYENLDVWYPGSTFRKYGIFGWGYNNTEMPVNWINLTPCSFVTRYGDTVNGYMFSLRDNVTCTCTTYQRIQLPDAVCWGSPAMFPN